MEKLQQPHGLMGVAASTVFPVVAFGVERRAEPMGEGCEERTRLCVTVRDECGSAPQINMKDFVTRPDRGKLVEFEHWVGATVPVADGSRCSPSPTRAAAVRCALSRAPLKKKPKVYPEAQNFTPPTLTDQGDRSAGIAGAKNSFRGAEGGREGSRLDWT